MEESNEILVVTDWEPDDVLAAMILSKRFEGRLTFVVSENDPVTIREKCFDIKYFFPHSEVFAGSTSEKVYNFKHNFSAKPIRIVPYADADAPLPKKPMMVFCLAPPRDLIAISMRDPYFFRNTIAFFYGGVNFAALRMHESFFDFGYWLGTAFLRAVVFETNFAYPHSDKFTMTSGPLMKKLEDMAPENKYYKRMHQISYLWDSHIKKQRFESAQKLLLKYPNVFPQPIDIENRAQEYMDRAKEGNLNPGDLIELMGDLTVYEATKNLDYQMVAADSLVAALFEESDEPDSAHDFKPVRFLAGERYHYQSERGSKLLLYDPIDKEKARTDLETKIIEILFN